ncbi:uncharacterized protein BX663DRAFT_501251 [Cokeromyces recurvatus]|uniref:uncharacterized protein n=1 Tax=Cokeromyces recurvatus TaxID=90255 RepID=UPI00221F71BB|nr:uncharacterized protein BX663DRAFT_501251 [Cokeromyces recurvatus]KAI7904978.1 hypothetical protein BX663DRAFT_501251 [Cokeromyces recurvatus]
MSFVLNSLPFEIIEIISANISKQDLLNVILVSKAWYHRFHASIYRSISIDNSTKQKQIISAFRTSPLLPGHLVHSLSLSKIHFSEHEIMELPKLFPDIDTLNMDWHIWGDIDFHTYFDPDAPISFVHPPQGLPPMIHQFFHHYGARHLRHLIIDATTATNETTDIWSILALCPHLRTLKLYNLNHEHIITLGYLETIHQLCPSLITLEIKCTRADPNPALFHHFSSFNHGHEGKEQDAIIRLKPTMLRHFSLSSKSGSSKWPIWLPYFSFKYPHLEHLKFKHCGLGDDGCLSQGIPKQVFQLFTHGCPELKSIHWSKIRVDHDQQNGLFSLCKEHHDETKQIQPFLYLEHIEAYENFRLPGSLHFSPIVQQGSLMSNLLTSLTIGQPPVDVTTHQVIRAIGQCKNLVNLKIQECFLDPDLAYNMDDILKYCKNLKRLYMKDVVIQASSSSSRNDRKDTITTTTTTTTIAADRHENRHPLREFIMKRSSFTEGAFQVISSYCPNLKHVALLGCYQNDRRDQVKIILNQQRLTTLKIQGLRTRNYYAGCRIRFFSINDNDWYYMSQFDIRPHSVGRKLSFQKFRYMEFAHRLDKLDDRDIQKLKSLVTTKTLKAWDVIAVKRNVDIPYTTSIDSSYWDPENIYYSGYVNIQCQSVQNLYINNKLVILNNTL